MINTYQTSVFPPAVPPRLRQQAPALASRRCSGGAGLRVLVVVVVLHLVLSVGGFFYLYTGRMIFPFKSATPNEEGKASPLSSEGRSEKASHTAMASMTVKRAKKPLEYLEWNMDHSMRRNVGYYRASWLRVTQPGDYYVYARVGFSRGEPGLSLVSMVRLMHDKAGTPRDMMKAYCSLGNNVDGLCTASQGQVLRLQEGNLLGVWVENSTWVDYERGATTFGMYKL